MEDKVGSVVEVFVPDAISLEVRVPALAQGYWLGSQGQDEGLPPGTARADPPQVLLFPFDNTASRLWVQCYPGGGYSAAGCQVEGWQERPIEGCWLRCDGDLMSHLCHIQPARELEPEDLYSSLPR